MKSRGKPRTILHNDIKGVNVVDTGLSRAETNLLSVDQAFEMWELQLSGNCRGYKRQFRGVSLVSAALSTSGRESKDYLVCLEKQSVSAYYGDFRGKPLVSAALINLRT